MTGAERLLVEQLLKRVKSIIGLFHQLLHYSKIYLIECDLFHSTLAVPFYSLTIEHGFVTLPLTDQCPRILAARL